METTFESGVITPEIKTVDQKQQIFVKLFQGPPSLVDVYVNEWLYEHGKNIAIQEQDVTSVVKGNDVTVFVLLRYMWINR